LKKLKEFILHILQYITPKKNIVSAQNNEKGAIKQDVVTKKFNEPVEPQSWVVITCSRLKNENFEPEIEENFDKKSDKKNKGRNDYLDICIRIYDFIKTNKKPNNDIPEAANIETATKVSKKVRRKALEILHAGGFIYKENEKSRQFKFNNEYEKYKPDDERILRKLEIEIDKKCKIN
jgi:hypothetical protein